MESTFSEIIQSDKSILVDFSAEWSSPCKIMDPILKGLKTMMGNAITILKVDIDKNPFVATSYQIRRVPTLVLFNCGNIKWRQSGIVSVKQLKQIIESINK